jgi:hypothetical protein
MKTVNVICPGCDHSFSFQVYDGQKDFEVPCQGETYIFFPIDGDWDHPDWMTETDYITFKKEEKGRYLNIWRSLGK